MSNMVNYNDIMAFHPGYYIADIIEDMDITQAEFAVRMNTSTKTLSNLINGQIRLSNDLAKKLSVMLGTSVEMWLNLQKKFDEKLIEIEKQKYLDSQVEVVALIDYSFFEQVAGLPHTRNSVEKAINLCGYLKLANLQVLKQPDFLVNFRTGVSTVKEKNIINAQAWMQTALNYAETIETKKFDAEKLKSYLDEIRDMTVQKPNDFISKLKDIFAECGVAFVMLPTLKNSGINGAVKWINSERVVLAINDRRHYADTFWFTLFHEIKHVLQQKVKTVFINGTKEEMKSQNNRLEEEADTFSQNILIPNDKLMNFIASKKSPITQEDIVSFAKEINIHPGIVVGRLEHEKVVGQGQFNRLKQQYGIVPTSN